MVAQTGTTTYCTGVIRHLLAALVAWTVIPVAAIAAPPDDPRELSRAGAEAFKAGQYAMAIEKLRAAREIAPAPVQLFIIARAYEELGQIDEAITAMKAFHSEAKTDGDRARAARRLTALEHRRKLQVATLIVRRVPSDAKITVDQRPYAGPAGALKLTLKPGEHRVAVSAPGFTSWERRLTLTGGTTRDLDVTLKAIETKAPAPVAPEEPSRSLEWALIGSGAALVAAGVGLTVASLGQHNSAEDGDVTQRAARDASELGTTLGISAWVAYGVGAALAITGGVLFSLDTDTQAAVIPLDDGALVSIGGRF